MVTHKGCRKQCGYETKIVSQRWDWDKETSKKLSVSLDGGLWLYQAWVANGTLIKRWGLEPTHHDGVCLGTAWRKWRNWKKKMYRDFLRKDVIVFNGIGKKRSDVARRGKKNPLGFNYVNELWGAKKKTITSERRKSKCTFIIILDSEWNTGISLSPMNTIPIGAIENVRSASAVVPNYRSRSPRLNAVNLWS